MEWDFFIFIFIFLFYFGGIYLCKSSPIPFVEAVITMVRVPSACWNSSYFSLVPARTGPNFTQIPVLDLIVKKRVDWTLEIKDFWIYEDWDKRIRNRFREKYFSNGKKGNIYIITLTWKSSSPKIKQFKVGTFFFFPCVGRKLGRLWVKYDVSRLGRRVIDYRSWTSNYKDLGFILILNLHKIQQKLFC